LSTTPTDIQNKEFERAFRGYEIEDVDDFLDQIAKDLEQLISENAELKEQVLQLQEKNRNYQKLEGTMHNAIVVAQETADDVKKNANREADLIRKEAEREARQIVEDARYRSSRIISEQEELFKQAQLFKMRFRSFIEAQLSNLESEDWLNERRSESSTREMKREFEPKMNYDLSEESSKPEEQFKVNLKSEPEPEPESEWEPDFDLDAEDDYESDPDI